MMIAARHPETFMPRVLALLNRLEKDGLNVIRRWALVAGLTMLAAFPAVAKNVGQELDDMQGRIAATAGGLAGTAALSEKQLLDALILKIQELRDIWKDSLDKTVDTLDLEQKKTLDTINQAAAQANSVIDNVKSVDDLAVLDINVLLSKVGLASVDKEARRVEPSAQIYKPAGIYTYVVMLPIFGTGNTISDIRLNKTSVIAQKTDLPPHGFRLNIPVSILNGVFEDWSLGQTKLEVDLQVSNRAWYQPWKKATRTQTVTLSLGMFPKQPLRYWLAEHSSHAEIDRDPAHLISLDSQVLPVAGCGNDGCNLYHNVCATAPVGTEPIGDLIATHDSFNGWGAFEGAPRVTANVICMTYHQHSHNQLRNVWFSTHYRPFKNVNDTHYYPLTALDVGGPQAADVPSKLQFLSASVKSQGNSKNTGSGPTANAAYVPPAGTQGPAARPLSYGKSYVAPLDAGSIWELVVQDFSGTTTVITTTGGSTKQIAATPEGARLKVVTQAPY